MDAARNLANPIRVFLVSDHQVLLWGLRQLVDSRSPVFQAVGTAGSCADALCHPEKNSADVILLDLDQDPSLVLDAIPQLCAEGDAKILIMTRSGDHALQDRAILAGAHGIVDKTTPPDLLLTALAKVHNGQIWLDREATGRIFVELSRRHAARATDPEERKISSLTEREREIIACIAGNSGNTGKTIATTLHISESTLRNHLTSIYEKLGVANRHGLLAYAFKHGLAKNFE